MPIVDLQLYSGRDDTVKAFLARGITDLVGELLCVDRDGVHVTFTERDRDQWAIGPRLVSQRVTAPTRTDPPGYLYVGRITVQPGKRAEYLSWRRHSVFPYMASHDGFLGSTLLTTEDPDTFVIINKWRDKAAEDAYTAHPREAELRVEARQFVVDLVSQSFAGDVVDVWSAPEPS